MYGFYVQRYSNKKELRRSFLKYTILSWLSPLIFAAVPLFLNAYGPSNLYCWIQGQQLLLIIFLLYAPMGILLIMLVYFYCQIIRGLKVDATDSETKAMLYELLFYPIGVILNYLVSAFDRFFNIGLGWNILYIAYFHLFVKQAQGFINALVYGGSSKVRKAIKAAWKDRKRIAEEDAFYFKAFAPGDLSQNLSYSSNSGASSLSFKGIQLS
jgi:hypothetical protein